MNQTWENGEKSNFGPDFGLFGHNFGPQIFLQVLPLLVVRHCSKLSSLCNLKKTIEPNLRKRKKTNLWPNFGLFGPNLGPKIFFHGIHLLQMLEIVASYHCMQFQGKLMNQTWENGQKLALSVTRYYGQLLSCTISEKTNDPILRKVSEGRTVGEMHRETNERE